MHLLLGQRHTFFQKSLTALLHEWVSAENDLHNIGMRTDEL